MAQVDLSIHQASRGVDETLGVAEGVLDDVDPIALMGSLPSRPHRRGVPTPGRRCPRSPASALRLVEGGIDVGVRTVSSRLDEPVATAAKDARFRDPAWAQNPLFRALLEWYLATTKLLLELVEAGDLDDATAPKAAFAAGSSPTRWRPRTCC